MKIWKATLRLLQIGIGAHFVGALALAQPGALDSTFRPPAFSNFVSIWPQARGKLIVSAPDPNDPSADVIKISRLTIAGAIDASFQPRLPAEFILVSAAPLTSDSILAAGRFGDDPATLRILKLQPSGELDESFSAALDVPANENWTVRLLARNDGKIWVTGGFTNVNGIPRPALARLNPDGTTDTDFLLRTNAYSIEKMAVQGENLLVMASFFYENSDAGERKFLRVLADGSIDAAFSPSANSVAYYVDGFVIDEANRILVTGVQVRLPDTRVIFWRLLPDGAPDPDFHELASDGDIIAAACQPDGKIVVAGFFETLNRITRRSLARLNPDGSLDLGFDAGRWQDGPTAYSYGVIVQSDGRIVLASHISLAPDAPLVRFWGDEYLRFAAPTLIARDTANLPFTNTMKNSWVLESSTDLMIWQPVATNGASATQLSAIDTSAGARFYRGAIR